MGRNFQKKNRYCFWALLMMKDIFYESFAYESMYKMGPILSKTIKQIQLNFVSYYRTYNEWMFSWRFIFWKNTKEENLVIWKFLRNFRLVIKCQNVGISKNTFGTPFKLFNVKYNNNININWFHWFGKKGSWRLPYSKGKHKEIIKSIVLYFFGNTFQVQI